MADVIPDGYAVEPLAQAHVPALAAAYTRNRAHLAPRDPLRPAAFFTESGQAADVAGRLRAVRQGLGLSWVLRHGEDVVGRVNVNNIVRGVSWSGSLGYWVDAAHTGRGLATALVEHAAAEAERVGLHRLEAGTMVDNLASQRVLLHAGFEEVGRAAAYLFIAGAWHDHLLFQRVLHDRPLDRPL